MYSKRQLQTSMSSTVFSHKNNERTFGFTVRPPLLAQQQTRLAQLQAQQVPPITDPAKKPMKWGEPTWYFFHTMAHKIKPEYFTQIKDEFLNMCFMICRNLPCPTCAQHAQAYIQNINFKSIQTPAQMKDLFFEFHNTVNKRKNFAVFTKQELETKYATAITANIIQQFMVAFQDKTRNQRMMADDFHRTRAIKTVRDWIVKNIQYFDM